MRLEDEETLKKLKRWHEQGLITLKGLEMAERATLGMSKEKGCEKPSCDKKCLNGMIEESKRLCSVKRVKLPVGSHFFQCYSITCPSCGSNHVSPSKLDVKKIVCDDCNHVFTRKGL